MKRANVSDVAQAAGVSTATVSRVLNTPERVSETTRKKVLTAIDELNFVKSATAFSFKVQQTYSVLVLVSNVGNTFYSEIFDGLHREAEAQGYNIVLATPDPENVSHQITERLRSGRVDGVIVLASVDLSKADYDLLKTIYGGTPPIVGFAEKRGVLRYPHILVDNRKAARGATQHLIDAGHVRIGHISGPKGWPVSEERQGGFSDAMEEAGLPVAEEDIFEGGFHRDFGRRAARRFARRVSRPTAMFCCNDETAMGFISELTILGINVPDEVSVVGFDNILVADVYVPALTTVGQPRAEIGARAMALLLEVLDDPHLNANRILELDVRLAKRASVARPKLSDSAPKNR